MRRRVPIARPLWRTLKTLVVHPGLLTSLHRRGIRTRFVGVPRLYVTISVVFLALLMFVLEGPRVELDLVDMNLIIHQAKDECPRTMRLVCRVTARAGESARLSRTAIPATFARRLLELTACMGILMMPVLAAVAACLYRRRGDRFTTHLTFAAHLHAFWFLLAAIALFVPARAAMGATIAGVVYASCSMQEIYGGRWRGTALRAATLIAIQVLLLTAASVAAALVLLGD